MSWPLVSTLHNHKRELGDLKCYRFFYFCVFLFTYRLDNLAYKSCNYKTKN